MRCSRIRRLGSGRLPSVPASAARRLFVDRMALGWSSPLAAVRVRVRRAGAGSACATVSLLACVGPECTRPLLPGPRRLVARDRARRAVPRSRSTREVQDTSLLMTLATSARAGGRPRPVAHHRHPWSSSARAIAARWRWQRPRTDDGWRPGAGAIAGAVPAEACRRRPTARRDPRRPTASRARPGSARVASRTAAPRARARSATGRPGRYRPASRPALAGAGHQPPLAQPAGERQVAYRSFDAAVRSSDQYSDADLPRAYRSASSPLMTRVSSLVHTRRTCANRPRIGPIRHVPWRRRRLRRRGPGGSGTCGSGFGMPAASRDAPGWPAPPRSSSRRSRPGGPPGAAPRRGCGGGGRTGSPRAGCAAPPR